MPVANGTFIINYIPDPSGQEGDPTIITKERAHNGTQSGHNRASAYDQLLSANKVLVEVMDTLGYVVWDVDSLLPGQGAQAVQVQNTIRTCLRRAMTTGSGNGDAPGISLHKPSLLGASTDISEHIAQHLA